MEACQKTLKDGETEQLVPVTKYRCICIPHRHELLILALTKLVLSLVLLVILFIVLSSFDFYGHPISLYHTMTIIAITFNVADIVIGTIIIISVIVKNQNTMKMYYITSFFVVTLLSFFCCVVTFKRSASLVDLLVVILIFFNVLMVQGYLNHLVKREVRKLESSEQIQL